MNTAQFQKRLIKVFAIFVLLGLISLTSAQLPRAKAAAGISSETSLQDDAKDSCDPDKLAASEKLFLQLTQQEQDLPGTVSQDDLQNAALQFTMESEKCYQELSQEEPVFIDDGGLWIPGYDPSKFVLKGTKWGAGSPFTMGNPPGTSGETVTFSFMSDGIDLTAESDSLPGNVAIASLPTYQGCFLTKIRNAFAAWSAISNIHFTEVIDNNQSFGNASASGDIRIGAHTFDGVGNTLAHGYYPPPNENSGAGDLHFDRQENWTCDTSGYDIGIVALHEIGHTIGLDHEPSITAVMNPTYNSSRNALQQDDINGARAIYGTTPGSTITTTHCGTISSNQSWISGGNVHVLDCDVTIAPGVTLTIAQGAVVKFQLGKSLFVQGSLRVLGVSGNPIYLTSIRDDTVGGDSNNDGAATAPGAGNWSRIEFQDSSNDANSLIDHAIIRYGGGCCYYGGITLLGASPTIQNTTLANNQNYAIRANVSSFPTLTGNTYTNNGVNGLALQGGTIAGNATWGMTDIAYFIADNVAVGPSATLTINPGVVVKFQDGRALLVQGSLRALGTSGSPVYFTSKRDDTIKGDTNNDGAATGPVPGNWSRIEFQDSSNDANSLIDHAIIRYGGGCCYWGGITLVSASPTIQNTALASNQNHAILANVTSFPTLTANTFTNNGVNGLSIQGGTISTSATWNMTNTSYYIVDNVAVGVGATLTINPGVVIKFQDGRSLLVQGSLRALGTLSSPIYLTSKRDDTIRGDTNNDGAATGPVPGNWSRIEFQDSSSDANSLIDHAIIRYGGGCCYWGGITLVSASPTIQNTALTSNQNHAILANVTSFPTLTANTYTNNGVNGLSIQGGTISTNATWNMTNSSYYIVDNVAVGVGSTLTINPGVVVKFQDGRSLLVQGSLRTLGTSGSPVYFTSKRDDTIKGDTNNDGAATGPVPGNWSRIEFQDSSSDANSLIDHAIIRYGGGCCYWGGITLVSASPTIQNTKIHNNQNYGIHTSNSTPTLGCNDIYSNGSYGLYNATTGVTVNAENQWWGSASGPYHPTQNPAGTGNKVSNGVDFDPFRTSSCDTPTLYTLTVSKTGTGSGTVTSDPPGINCGVDCSEAYNSGTTVILTPSPAVGSAFTGWSGGGCSGTDSCTVTMIASKSVTANFADACFAINTFGNPADGGSIGINQLSDGIYNPPPTCHDDNEYPLGAVIRLTAHPEVGYEFLQWSGDVSGSENPVELTMSSNKNVSATFVSLTANSDVYIGGELKGSYEIPPQGSIRQSYLAVNDGPVEITGRAGLSMLGAERVIYKINGVNTSFTEMMGLPAGQLDTTYWLPWYNNVDLDTQLRIANVSGSQATVTVTIGGVPQPSFSLAAGASTRVSYPVNNGPVKIVSTQNIVAAERVIYKVNGVNTSFSEMMALPQRQLDTVYYLPWYNNVDLDTQLRIANVTGQPATVTVMIGNVPQPSFTLAAGASTRLSYAANNGPVKIQSTQNIVAAERVIYKVNNRNTSFTEMMALPASEVSSTYWLPWYNNVDLDTQLRIANVSGSQAMVTVTIGGVAQPSFNLAVGASTRLSYPANNGPVKIVSTQNIVAAERVIYKVNGVNTSFSEMMGLPNGHLATTYWLPWYNNVDLDTQLRFGVP
jgi:hypothetical protein